MLQSKDPFPTSPKFGAWFLVKNLKVWGGTTLVFVPATWRKQKRFSVLLFAFRLPWETRVVVCCFTQSEEMYTGVLGDMEHLRWWLDRTADVQIISLGTNNNPISHVKNLDMQEYKVWNNKENCRNKRRFEKSRLRLILLIYPSFFLFLMTPLAVAKPLCNSVWRFSLPSYIGWGN